ncbi:MAG: transglutaminase TgpA family protein [Burkholderiales bacterium]
MSSPHPLAPEQRAVMPRELAALLASLVLVVAPHALRMPWWLSVLVAGLYAWRVAVALGWAETPSRWLLLLVAVLCIAVVYLEYRTLFGRTTGIVLLGVFSGLKLMEMRSHRDAAVIAFLCYFLVMTNLMYTQSIPTALLMLVALVAITATLVGLAAPRRPARANLATAGLLLAHAAPAALVLFLLFPRVEGPLWALPQDAYAGLTGLSDTMSPGNLSLLAQSDAIAFRAEFEGDPPPPRERYWRGPVLWDFDGRTWRMGPGWVEPLDPPRGSGRYDYTVTLEPHNRTWLFALERVASLPRRSRLTNDGMVVSAEPVRTRLRYDAASVAHPDPEPLEREGSLRRALVLPAQGNPRARALAERWRRESAGPADIVSRAIDYFRDSRLAYTLEPPLLGRDTVDEFLFDTRAGFCEHFASSFVFLMRAAGVPARVVTGYQGGEVNYVDRVITVRQSDAHAWAEVFLTGRGWVRMDPTAAAVPGRVDAGLARSVREGDPVPLLLRPQLEWLRSLRSNWEAIAYRWNVWVLGYGVDRQRDLMSRIGMRDADWRKLTATMATVLGAFTLGLIAWSLGRRVRPDPVQRAWLAFCRKLAARGVVRAAHEGPRDFAVRAARRLPAAGPRILAVGELYVVARYGRDTAPERVAELRRRVRDLELA